MTVRMGAAAPWGQDRHFSQTVTWEGARDIPAGHGVVDWTRLRARVGGLLSLSLLSNQYPALHGVRVFAIFAVVQVHLTNALVHYRVVERSAVTHFSQKIFFGMDLFFILSGFLIGSVLLHAGQSHQSGRSLGRFYLRRAFRTFPLYYAALLGLVLMGIEHRGILPDLFYATNYVPGAMRRSVMEWGWSLCVEEHFYLLAPLLFVVLGWVRAPWAQLAVLLGLWLLGFGLRLGTFLDHIGPWRPGEMFDTFYVKTHTRFDILVAGVAVAYMQFHFGPRLKTILSRPLVVAALALISLLCLAFLLLPFGFVLGRGLYKVLCWGTVTSIMYVPLLLLLINRAGLLIRFLGAPIFLKAATLGYGVYLVHIPVLGLVTPLLACAGPKLGLSLPVLVAAVFALTMAASFAVAYGLHLLVEKPALALRDRLVPSR